MYMIFVASQNENMKLAKKIQNELSSLGKKSEIIDLVGLELPLYTPKTQEKSGVPTLINEYVKKMTQCDGYVFVAPEYNYSTPVSLGSFISWLSVVGDDFRAVFSEKVSLIATHSGGGGNDVLNSMRNQLTKLGSLVIPRQILTSYQAPLKEESLSKTVEQFIKFS